MRLPSWPCPSSTVCSDACSRSFASTGRILRPRMPKFCNPLWAASTGGSVDSSPAVANGMVYVGSTDGELYAYGLP